MNSEFVLNATPDDSQLETVPGLDDADSGPEEVTHSMISGPS